MADYPILDSSFPWPVSSSRTSLKTKSRLLSPHIPSLDCMACHAGIAGGVCAAVASPVITQAVAWGFKGFRLRCPIFDVFKISSTMISRLHNANQTSKIVVNWPRFHSCILTFLSHHSFGSLFKSNP